MRTHILFTALFSLFAIAGLHAQGNPDQFSRWEGAGKKADPSLDTLSQKFISDYQLVVSAPQKINWLDSVFTVVTGNDSIRLQPIIKGKATMVNGELIFKEFTDIIIMPNTQGIIVPGSVEFSGGKVVKFKVSLWEPDKDGPRDDLFLTYVVGTDAKGSFVFGSKNGDQVKLGLYEYKVVDDSNAPLVLKMKKKSYEANKATGRKYAPVTKPKQ